jgi:hypothetical protein
MIHRSRVNNLEFGGAGDHSSLLRSRNGAIKLPPKNTNFLGNDTAFNPAWKNRELRQYGEGKI